MLMQPDLYCAIHGVFCIIYSWHVRMFHTTPRGIAKKLRKGIARAAFFLFRACHHQHVGFFSSRQQCVKTTFVLAREHSSLSIRGKNYARSLVRFRPLHFFSFATQMKEKAFFKIYLCAYSCYTFSSVWSSLFFYLENISHLIFFLNPRSLHVPYTRRAIFFLT